MSQPDPPTPFTPPMQATAFDGTRCLVSGPLQQVALAVKTAVEAGDEGPFLVFEDETGRVVDLDLRGTPGEVAARLSPPVVPRGRGRPKLGVVPREVTLLPRHWEWLNAQPGGASVALRKLVEAARRKGGERERIRGAQEGAYRFMAAMAGDCPGFEEALRALFAADRERFELHTRTWPVDVREHALRMAREVFPGAETGEGE